MVLARLSWETWFTAKVVLLENWLKTTLLNLKSSMILMLIIMMTKMSYLNLHSLKKMFHWLRQVIKLEDLTEGGYTFEDVILPVPGSRVIYPDNAVADVYRELAHKDFISLTESVHSAKEFSITCMTGGYRRVFQRPSDFTWELVSYADDGVPLVETDFDAISKKVPRGIMNSSCSSSCLSKENSSKQSPGSDGHNKKLDGSEERAPHVDHVCSSGAQSPQIALKLAFTLPASCYATMAIRELLKSSTSVAYQKTLNS